MKKNPPIGVYEKALPSAIDWHERLALAKQVGFDFVELSCDESVERQARLDWSPAQRADLRQAISASGVPLLTLCLSAHRRFALGSADPAIRQHGLTLLQKAIDFAVISAFAPSRSPVTTTTMAHPTAIPNAASSMG